MSHRPSSPDCAECARSQQSASSCDAYPKCKECGACIHCVGEQHSHHSDMTSDPYYFRRKYGNRDIHEKIPPAPLGVPPAAAPNHITVSNDTKYAAQPPQQVYVYPSAPAVPGYSGPVQYINGPTLAGQPQYIPVEHKPRTSDEGLGPTHYTRGPHEKSWDREYTDQVATQARPSNAWPNYINGPNTSMHTSGQQIKVNGSSEQHPPAQYIHGPSGQTMYTPTERYRYN